MDDGLRIAGVEGATLVGRGGFGAVFRATQPAFGRQVAVKVLPEVLDDAGRERFERERRALGALSGHPNVVTVHDSGITGDGRPYLVMEYLPGGSVGEKAGSSRPLPWDDVARLGVKLAGALETSHRTGVLHLDVKPDNILVSRYGEPKLADFGVAQLASAARTGPAFASLTHAAPELLAGRAPSPASDVYSLGSTLAALATGRPVFAPAADETPVALAARIVAEPATVDVPGAPPALARALEKAMAKEPGARQPTAEALGRDLQRALLDAGIEPTAIPLGSQAEATRTAASGEDTRGAPWRPAAAPAAGASSAGQARPTVAVAAVAAVLLAVAVVAVAVVATRDDGPSVQAGSGDAASVTSATSPPVGDRTGPPTTAAAPTTVAAGPAPCIEALAYGELTQCAIETPGQTRRHSFQGAAGDRVLVDTAQVEGDVLPGIAVLRPDGTDACPSLRECVLDRSGRHTVLVADTFGPIAGKNTGEYSLFLQRLNDPVGCRPLRYGVATEGAIARPGQVDCLTFTGSPGDRLFITSVNTAGNLVPALAVIRADGTDACAKLSECVLDAGGRHTVILSDTTGVATGNRTGTYRVTLTCTAGPCR